MSTPNAEALALIAHLGLQPLPHEGGYFARTWTSRETTATGRPAGTAIYFLLTPDGFSALHRLDADEIWHFHAGDPVEHVQLWTDADAASAHTALLGAAFTLGQVAQLIVPAGRWQGARLAPGATRGWALVSCTMSPGWAETGFALGKRAELLAAFPRNAASICALTRCIDAR
jgi:uncharacterized protein